jgi:hypothetical protein
MQEQEGRLTENGHEFLEAQIRQTRALQAEERAYAYAAEEHARARHHAAHVAQLAGLTQDLQGRIEHMLFEDRAEIHALPGDVIRAVMIFLLASTSWDSHPMDSQVEVKVPV